MHIEINFGNFPSSEALTEQVNAEVEKQLRRHAERLTRVEVHLQDLNGPKGGVDKRCLMEARPRGLDPIAVDHEGGDFYLCVREAAGKLDRALRRRFEKLAEQH